MELAPIKFLDTEITYNANAIKTAVYRSENKIPVHWSSNIPKKYKRNAINADLHRAAKISSNLSQEKDVNTRKFSKARFPRRFVDSVVRQYDTKGCYEIDDAEMIIPENFFNSLKKHVVLEFPYCPKNEDVAKCFLENSRTLLTMNMM